jgi:hypothetical protein
VDHLASVPDQVNLGHHSQHSGNMNSGYGLAVVPCSSVYAQHRLTFVLHLKIVHARMCSEQHTVQHHAARVYFCFCFCFSVPVWMMLTRVNFL